MNKTNNKLLLLLFLFLFFPLSSYACAMCAWAMLGNVFPPANSWFIIGFIWLISQSIINGLFHITPPLKISFTEIMIAVGASVIAAFVVIGPPIFFWMPAVAILQLLFLIFSEKGKSLDKNYKTISISFSIFFILLLIYTYFSDIRKYEQLTIADKIQKWQGTYLENDLLNQLKDSEPLSIEEYRNLLLKKNLNISIYQKAATRLAEIESSQKDLSIILNTIEHIERQKISRDNYFKDVRESLEQALNKIGKLNLPLGTPTRIWKEKINQVLKTEKNSQ